MDISPAQIPIYVINMARSAERLQRFDTQARAAGLAYHRIEAIDGAARHGWEFFEFEPQAGRRVFRHRSKPISPYELCCTASHIKAIRAAYEAGCEMALICEDDVELSLGTLGDITALIGKAPAQWTILQLATLPDSAGAALAEHWRTHEQLFVAKTTANPILCAHTALTEITVHGAAAYVINRAGMTNVIGHLNRRGQVVAACTAEEAAQNVELVADRLTYRLAAGDQAGAWVSTLPLVTIEARDSTIHPDHVPSHRAARQTARSIRARTGPMATAIGAYRAGPTIGAPPRVAISAFVGAAPLHMAQAQVWARSLRRVLAPGAADLVLHSAPDAPHIGAGTFGPDGVFVIPVPHALSGPDPRLTQLNCGALAGYDLTILSALDSFFFSSPVPQILPEHITVAPPLGTPPKEHAALAEDGLWLIPGGASETLRHHWARRHTLPIQEQRSALVVSLNTPKSAYSQLNTQDIALLRYGSNILPSGLLRQTGIAQLDRLVARANQLLHPSPGSPL